MKKKTVLLIVLAALCAVMLSACGKLTAATTDQFISVADDMDLQHTDILDQYAEESNGAITKATLAAPSDLSWQVEFYELDSENDAVLMYNNQKDIVDDFIESASSHSGTETDTDTTQIYKQTAEGTYYVLIRVDNTFLYAENDKEYKDNVDEFLDALGY